MSQEKNGEPESKVAESISKINASLDDFSNRAGLKIYPSDDISMYLNYDDTMLSKMDADDAGHAAFVVSRHAAYVKKLYNRELAILKWARSTLNSLAVRKCSSYVDSKYMKLEEKIAIVVSENEYARELNKHMMAADMRTTEIYDMYDQLNKLSDKFTDIQRTKRSERFQK